MGMQKLSEVGLSLGLAAFISLGTLLVPTFSEARDGINPLNDGAVDVVGTPCLNRLTAITAGTESKISITHLTYRHAGAALKHYRSEILNGESRGEDFEVHIEEATEFYATNGRILGRKVTITDGGDESAVDYYYDHRRKLITAYWHNQSPIRYWFCR